MKAALMEGDLGVWQIMDGEYLLWDLFGTLTIPVSVIMFLIFIIVLLCINVKGTFCDVIRLFQK